MTHLNNLISFLNKIAYGIWGLTIADLFFFVDLNQFSFFSNIDDTIKTFMAFMGAIFFAVQLPFKIIDMIQKRKLGKLELEIKEEDLERKKNENEKSNNNP